MLETKSSDYKDTDPKPKSSFLAVLLKTENLDTNLLKVLYEFLLTYDFESTAKCLLKEANKLGYETLDKSFFPKDVIPEDVCNQILAEFKAGDWKRFFKLWNDSLPESIKSTMDYKVLTMKLRVHFAILPISKGLSFKEMQNGINNAEGGFDSDPDVETAHDTQKAASMNQLKKYLRTDGMELVSCSACIPFFALPYVENPMNDSTVSHIFTSSWVDELSMNLKIFLVKHRQIVSPKQSRTPSPNAFTKPMTRELNNKEQMEQIEKNLQILDSLDLEDSERRNMVLHNFTNTQRLEIVKTPSEDLRDDYVRIIPNDRDIPVFFEEELEEFSYHRKTKVKIRSTQTRIQGIKNTTTFLATDEFSHPVRVLDPQILLKSPKKSTKKYEEQLSWTMTRLHNIHGDHQRLKLRFHQLHSDYHKLIEIAGELTKALENSVRGNPVSVQHVLESCIIILPDLFHKNLRVDSKDELMLKSEDKVQQNQIKIAHCFDLTPLSPKRIDFKKIKFHLTCGSLKTKLLLLQALRWKITLSQQGERDEVLHEYISNDLLGLRGNIASNVGKQILPYILYQTEVSVLEQSAARLLNTVASLRCGRDYLSIGTITLNAVVECLNGNNDSGPNAFTYDMLLAMLQKLSVRKLQRINMIEAGLVEWLIHHLNVDGCKMSPYRLKYVTALLMNLSLHSKAQNKASSEARLVISLLTDLLLTEHQNALPFISGALSNFLLNRNINEEGKRLGLESVLKYYRKRSSVETREYLDHIIKLHNREDDVEKIEISDNDNDEYDLIEDELDEDDPVQNEAGELAGEMLLASYYSLSANTTSGEIEKSDSQSGGLQQILQNREMIPRLSKEKNPIRLQPVYKTSYVEENTNSSKLLGTVSQIEGEQSPENSLTQGNSSMMNLIDYTSAEDSKLQKSSCDFYSSPLYGVTTIYQQQAPANNYCEWSQFLNPNSEKSSKNRRSKSKKTPVINIPLEISQSMIQSSFKTSDEEVDLTQKTSGEISKENSKVTTSVSVPIGIDSLPEVPDVLSSIASL